MPDINDNPLAMGDDDLWAEITEATGAERPLSQSAHTFKPLPVEVSMPELQPVPLSAIVPPAAPRPGRLGTVAPAPPRPTTAKRGKRFSDTVVAAAVLDTWEEKKRVLAHAKSDERSFRDSFVDTLFPMAGEGSHNLDVDDGRVLNLTQGVDRKVDIASLDGIRAAMLERFDVDVDNLLRWKPELDMKAYRGLDDESRTFFEQCLVITDSAPQLKINEPAAYKKAKAARNG